MLKGAKNMLNGAKKKMTIEKLQRVILLLRERYPKRIYTLKQVRNAIMTEIGTDDRTLMVSMEKIRELGYLRRYSRHVFNDTSMEI